MSTLELSNKNESLASCVLKGFATSAVVMLIILCLVWGGSMVHSEIFNKDKKNSDIWSPFDSWYVWVPTIFGVAFLNACKEGYKWYH